jgi:voltage-gated potassium channel Kch
MREGSRLRAFSAGQAVRLASVAAVFILGVGAFASGVNTTEIADMGEQSLLAWLYYCAGLFVLGGLDLGIPAGGAVLGRTALWVAYFLAPTITVAAVIEAALRLIRSERSGLGALRGHAVLVGGGRLGQTYLQALCAVEPNKAVLHVVGADGRSDVAAPISPSNVEVLAGNAADPGMLELAGLGEAEEMVVIGEDDLSNLEIAWAAKALQPELPVAVHVTDLTLLRPVNRMIRESASAGGERAPLVFNTHRIAALHLYEHLLHPHFENTGYRDVFVLGGFGGFAQTILELLRAMAVDELEHVVIVDENAARNLRQFEADVSLEALNHSAVDGALEDPDTWSRVDAIVAPMEATPVYMLASADEIVNFRTAMLLRGRAPDIRIFARCFRRTRFADILATERSFELFAFEEVLHEAMQDHFRNLRAV